MAPENTSASKTFRSTVGDTPYDVVVSEDGASVGDKVFGVRRVTDGSLLIEADGARITAVLETGPDGTVPDGTVVVWIDGHRIPVVVHDERDKLLERYGISSSESQRHHEARAPMPGLVVRLLVEEGQEVAKGDSLVVLEAMKMENEIRAEADGVVSSIHVSAGDAVTKNAVLIEFES
jgi:biotin carboxyl carrier protein